ncbi:MAG TPA: hypothetical protein VGN17_05705 [Bryobacteraceae bacterium]
MRRALPVAVLAASLLAQQPDPAIFKANSKLVLVPFTVARGKFLAADIQPSDVILRENGHPREFTVFQGPNTANVVPLELILLFDSTSYSASRALALHSFWDAKAAYEFLKDEDEPAIHSILEKNGIDIRVSVYHYADRQLERLSQATRDPKELLSAFRRLLDPIPAGQGRLTLLPGGFDLAAPTKGLTVYTSAWLWESIVASLKDATDSPEASARRIMFVFSEGYSATTVPHRDVAEAAVALGVPIYPVLLNRSKYVEHPFGVTNVQGPYSAEAPSSTTGPPRYVFAPPAASLGDMTDGRVYFPAHLDRKEFVGILQGARDAELAKYVVGFVPDPSQPTRKRRLEVQLKSKSAGKVVGGYREIHY